MLAEPAEPGQCPEGGPMLRAVASASFSRRLPCHLGWLRFQTEWFHPKWKAA